MNLGTKPQELKAGMGIVIYQPVKKDQIEVIDARAKSVLPGAIPRPRTPAVKTGEAYLSIRGPLR